MAERRLIVPEEEPGPGSPGVITEGEITFSFPSFATLAYYQALSRDEQQYGSEAEYRKQFYQFIQQLHQQVYDALVNDETTISRGEDYDPYPDFPTLADEVNSFFDGIFGKEGTVDVSEVLTNPLFSEAITEYNLAPGNYDFAAGWETVSTPATLEENALAQREENEQKESLWETQIRPALEAGGEFIQTALFGKTPSGTPKTFDEMFDEWMQTQMDQLKGPLTVTLDPNKGLLAEIKIPIGFEVNGRPLELPIFDADGNFVLPETIEDVFVTWDSGKNIIKATVDGVTETIGEIFEGTDGNLVTRVFDAAGNVVSELGLGGIGVDKGSATGILTGAVLSGDLFYSSESGTFEQGQEVSADELLEGDSDLNGTDELDTTEEETTTNEETTTEEQTTTGEQDPGNLGLIEEEEEEEDRVAYLSDVVAAKEEVLQTLGSQLEGLGLDVNEVKSILDTVQEQLDGVATIENLDALRSDLTQTITDELAALGIDDIQSTLDVVNEDLDTLATSLEDLSKAVGLPAVADDPNTPEDESRAATGLYAAIEQGEAATKEYMDGLAADLEALGTDVANIPGLIEGLAESTKQELEDLGYSQQEIKDLLGAPGTDETEATGIYASIDELSTEIDTLSTDLNSRIDELVQSGADRADAVDQALADLAEANNTSTETILSDLGTTKDELLGEISGLSDRVGAPAEYDEEGNVVSEATGLYAEVNDLIVNQGLSFQDALDTAVAGLSNELGLSEQSLLNSLDTTKDELLGEITGVSDRLGSPASYDEQGNLVSEATGLYAEVSDLITGQGLEFQDALDTALGGLSDELGLTEESLLDQLGTTREELFGEIEGITADLGSLSGRVGTPAEYDESGNLVSEATGLYSEVNTLMAEQGLSFQDALDTAVSGLSNELGLSEQSLLDQLGITKNELAGQISGLSDQVGLPTQFDEAGNVTSESTGLYAEIDALVAQGVARDDAVDQVLADLAVQYDTSTGAILEQLGTTQASLSGLTTDITGLTGLVGQPAAYDIEGNLTSESTGLYAEIDALESAGIARDAAVNQVLTDLAAQYDTSTQDILNQLGTTEGVLQEGIAGVSGDVATLAGIVGQEAQYDEQNNLVSASTGLFADMDALMAQGASQSEALFTAVGNLSDQLGTTETELLGALSESETRISDLIGRPGVSDDPFTEEDEGVPATGVYADIEKASAGGGWGGGGAGARAGYMGGLSYQLPGFVGVGYQPKDYTVELDRIINESLFGDMIA